MLGEREQRHGSRGSMSDMTSVLHMILPSMPKGEIVDYFGWLSLMSTLEESLVEIFGNTMFWVMDQSCLIDNGMSFDIFEGNTILYGCYISFHFYWYVERHINPHGLRVMAL